MTVVPAATRPASQSACLFLGNLRWAAASGNRTMLVRDDRRGEQRVHSGRLEFHVFHEGSSATDRCQETFPTSRAQARQRGTGLVELGSSAAGRNGLTPISRCSISRAPSSAGKRAVYWERF